MTCESYPSRSGNTCAVCGVDFKGHPHCYACGILTGNRHHSPSFCVIDGLKFCGLHYVELKRGEYLHPETKGNQEVIMFLRDNHLILFMVPAMALHKIVDLDVDLCTLPVEERTKRVYEFVSSNFKPTPFKVK